MASGKKGRSVIKCHTAEELAGHMDQAKESRKLVIIDFTASWCEPCNAIAKVFTKYAKKFASAVFLMVDVDELKIVAEQHDVKVVPTFVFIKDGQKIDAIVGASKEELHASIQRHVAAA